MKISAIQITIGIVLVTAIIAGSVFYITKDDTQTSTTIERPVATSDEAKAKEDTTSEETPSIAASPETYGETETLAAQDEAQLLYLIEEEKLAHDIYSAFYDMYGQRVFGNILKSESTHQDRVLTLLEARDIADPRSEDPGVFTNSDLQSLYDTLLARGKQSELEAMRVGVLIEETDIADITKQLATTQATDIIAALEDLRRGSENHLRAFTRQL